MIAEALTSADEASFNWHVIVAMLQILSPVFALGIFLWKQSNPDKVNIQQPLKVDVIKDLATKEELRSHREEVIREQNKLEQRMTHLERKMESDKTEIIEAGEERVVKLHNRMNEVLSGLSELKGEIKGRFAKP
jgi:hypothetical protein